MTNVTDWNYGLWPWDAIATKLKARERGIADILYVPWHQRRVHWRHDHNTGDERDWQPDKIAAVGKLKKVRDGLFQAACPCGTLFVAEADHHVVDPPLRALGVL